MNAMREGAAHSKAATTLADVYTHNYYPPNYRRTAALQLHDRRKSLYESSYEISLKKEQRSITKLYNYIKQM